MKIILTVGHAFSGHQDIHETLIAAGVVEAHAVRRESLVLTPHGLTEKLLRANDVSNNSSQQFHPGKLWEELVTDLFLANLDHDVWGWTDSRLIKLLDWLRDFDTQIRFVLAYSSPAQTLGQIIKEGTVTAEEIALALSQWQSSNSELLRFYHRNRERCFLCHGLAVRNAPQPLVEEIGRAFDVAFISSPDLPKLDADDSWVATILADTLIHEYYDIHHLYQELEDSADFNSASVEVGLNQYLQAWAEYSRGFQLRKSQEQETLSLGRLNEQYKTRNAELVQENELLLKQLKQAKDELESSYKINKELISQSHIMEQCQNSNAELSQENELLLEQLFQVQEELENYYLKYQDLSQGKMLPASAVDSPWECLQLVFGLDLRQEFEGVNWYHAEHDGRWAGPENLSTIKLPVLAAGTYRLEIDVVDAIAADILSGMDVHMNGAAIEISHDCDGYPALSRGDFSVNNESHNEPLMISLIFPRLVSPADFGSDDTRQLAIRIGRVMVVRLC